MGYDIEHPDITYINRTGNRRGEYYPDDVFGDAGDFDEETDEEDEKMKVEAVEVTPSVRLQFVSYKKAKTQATLLKDMEPGDILRIEFQFGDDNNRYGRAARVFLVNETQGTSVVKYASAAYGALLRMNLEEVTE